MLNDKADEGYKKLAVGIVVKAIEDWRVLIAARAWADGYELPNKNFEELREFFKSEYCELLLCWSTIKGVDILRLLEKELEEAIREDRPRSISYVTFRCT